MYRAFRSDDFLSQTFTVITRWGRRQPAVDKDKKLTKQMNRVSGIRLQPASAVVPDLRMRQKSIDSWFVDQIFAFFIVNSLEAALVADLTYSWWGNQQSYPQFLLTTFFLIKRARLEEK